MENNLIIYIALAAEVGIVLLFLFTRFDLKLTGETKPPFFVWRLMPVSFLLIVWVLEHRWEPDWPENPQRWAQKMVLVFIVELVCNLGIRNRLAKRKGNEEKYRRAKKKIRYWMNRVSNLVFIVFVVLDPIFLPGVARGEISVNGWRIAWVVFAIQLLCIVVFFWKKQVLASWLTERCKKSGIVLDVEAEGTVDLTDSAQWAFFFYSMLFFGNLLPYSLYMRDTYDMMAIYCMLLWSFSVWVLMFQSSLYQVLTAEREMPPARYRFPWVSFFAVIWAVWNFPLPYDPMKVAVIILSVFLLENILLILLRVYFVQRNGFSRQRQR